MNVLTSGASLKPGDSITSPNGRYRLELETTGDLVLNGPTGAAWKSGTWGKSVETAEMQTDGNFVLYAPGRVPVWDTKSDGPGGHLVLQDDRNIVIYARDGFTVLWTPNCYVPDAERAAEDEAIANAQARTVEATGPINAAPAAAPAPRTYTVERGDTLSAIAKRFYGNAGEYRRIAAANNIPNPDLIHPGQQLVIPD
jgi:LysM repeat protein